jgi:hypothetical protein
MKQRSVVFAAALPLTVPIAGCSGPFVLLPGSPSKVRPSPRRTTRVGTQDEFDRFSDAYERKYGRRPRNDNVTEAYLFRLAAR